MAKPISVIVTATLPPRVTAAAFKAYVENEVRAAVGGLPPNDPLFHLDRDTVKVRHLKVAPGTVNGRA